MSPKGTLLTIVIAAGLGLLLFRALRHDGSKPPAGTETRTLEGKPWRLEDQRGKVVLLDFWATWCPYCIKAMPDMKHLHEQFKDRPGFLMVSVSEDDDAETVQNFLKNTPLPWIQLLDPHGGGLAPFFGISGLPTTVLLDKEGKEAARDLPHGQLAQAITSLLEK